MEVLLRWEHWVYPAPLLFFCVLFALKARWDSRSIRIIDGHEIAGPWRFRKASEWSARIHDHYRSRRQQVRLEKWLATGLGVAALVTIVILHLVK